MQGHEYHPMPNYSQDPEVRDNFKSMTLGNQGPSIVLNLPKAGANVRTETNKLEDIERTKPMLKAYQYTNKPNRYNTDDIDGAQSRQLHPQNPYKVLSRDLDVSDIAGTKPKAYSFQTNRQTNPLYPNDYKLPGCETDYKTPNGVFEGKQLREFQGTQDIRGAQPKPVFKYSQRQNDQVDDIEGTQVGWKPRHERRPNQPRQVLNTEDINNKMKGTLRDAGADSSGVVRPQQRLGLTNVLRPKYVVNGMLIEDDPLSMPASLTKARDGGRAPNFSLTTQDIPGAESGWRPPHECGGITEETRRQFRKINDTTDIQGSTTNAKFVTDSWSR
jgi:hypothetical protein